MDEMELVGRLKEVEPLRDEEFERARMALHAAMVVSDLDLESVPVFGQGQGQARAHRRPRRPTVITRGKVGVGLGIGVAAAAVAVALVATSTPKPAPTASLPTAAPAKAKPSTGSQSASLVVNSQLITVADIIKSTSGPLSGNASLVIRTQANSGVPAVNFEVYTDSGAYYWATTRGGLLDAIASHQDRSGGLSVHEVSAALYAANGDLAAARVRMINATPNPFGLGDTPAQKKALAKKIFAQDARLRHDGIKVSGPDKGKALQHDYDNYVWNNSMDALTEGGGNPQVRIGVLRLLSTLPEVTVKSSTTGGQRTLTLTAGTALFGGLTDQVVTINAKTGIPLSSASGIPGRQPSSTSTFQVSRLTLADIEAGKF